MFVELNIHRHTSVTLNKYQGFVCEAIEASLIGIRQKNDIFNQFKFNCDLLQRHPVTVLS